MVTIFILITRLVKTEKILGNVNTALKAVGASAQALSRVLLCTQRASFFDTNK